MPGLMNSVGIGLIGFATYYMWGWPGMVFAVGLWAVVLGAVLMLRDILRPKE